MTTEYRRGIPSVAHVEAATRLGLLWHRENAYADHQTRFGMLPNGDIGSTFGSALGNTPVERIWQSEHEAAYRPIRTDGTPVDWEVLDAEVARAQPLIGRDADGTRFAINTDGSRSPLPPAASAAPTTQPQGFRADLWRRICAWVESTYLPNIASIVSINDDGIIGQARRYSWDVLGLDTQTDEADRQALIARWVVYQELKPLYDLVDGAQGEVAMPEDVELEWCLRGDCAAAAASEDWILKRGTELTIERPSVHWHPIWRPGETPLGIPILNFAAVLDAVAEQRVAARQGQAQQPNSVTLSVGPSSAFQYETPVVTPEPRSFADVRPDRHGWRWWRVEHAPGNAGIDNSRFEVSGTQWRWLAMGSEGITPSGTLIQSNDWTHLDIWSLRTVIPTDEQGNPVSWESIGQGRGIAQAGRDVEEDRPRLASRFMPAREFIPPPNSVPTYQRMLDGINRDIRDSIERQASEAVQRATDSFLRQTPGLLVNPVTGFVEAVQSNEQRLAENHELWREAQREAASSPRTAEAIYQDLLARHQARSAVQTTFNGESWPVIPIEATPTTQGTWARQTEGRTLRQQPTQPVPLPRFTADELDDVDHSATTTQDSATLKRGKLPTVEAIGKYREVMAKRNGTVAEAVKASGIDCEVAQYVLERWAGGLSDREAEILCNEAHNAVGFARADVDKRLSRWFAIIRPTLDTSEPADTAAQRQRAEAAERATRMAALQAQLAKERAARVAEPQEEPTRFSLLEVDEAADPVRSIEAWKAQRAALKSASVVRPVALPAPQHAPAPRRKPFEVVDAQADGLSGTAALAVLLGRAMNGGC